MTPLFERATRVADLPGVRAGLLVEAVSVSIAHLAKRRNGLTRNMRASFNYVTATKVHFVLVVNGEQQGLFRFSYDPDGFRPATLRKLTPGRGDPLEPDEKTLSFERLFSLQLAKAYDSIWMPRANGA
jgi:hypothetical protein